MAVNLEEIRKKYEELKQKKSSGGDTDWMELQDGDNLVRFLSDDEGNFYHETGYHYIKQGKNKVSVVCNRLNDGEDCYLCDVVSELYKSKDKTDKELAKELGAKARIFFNVVDRADDNKVKVLGAGNMIFKDLLKYFADEDWGDLTDPVAGRDVVINKSGQGMDTEYTVMPKPKTTKLGCEVELHDLSAIPYPHTNEEQEMLLNGMSTEEVAKLRKEASDDGDVKEPSKAKESKEADKPTPTRKPAKKEQTLEERYADQIGQIDLDIPKAQKALKNWLEDDDRTDEELEEIIAKFGKEDDTPEPEAKSSSKSSSKDKEAESDDLDAEVAKALEKFKKKK